MKSTIIFIGGRGTESEFGGELTKNKEIYKRFLDLEFKPFWIDTYKANHSKIKLIKIIWKILYAFIRFPSAPIIFSTSFNNIYLILKVISRIKINRRIIYWVIGGIFGERVRNNEFELDSLKQIDLFLVEGEVMRKQLKEVGFSNVEYVPNFKTIKRLIKKDYYEDGFVNFLFISRIIPQKGCEDIIHAAINLKKMGLSGKFRIDFYGQVDLEYQKIFFNQIENIPEIEYKGKIDLNNQENYYMLAHYDYMLFPTFWKGEGFPGVIIDAYCAGLPIISSNWNFNTEFVIDGETGIIVNAMDTEDLTEKMRQAVSKEYDLYKLSKNAFERAKKYETTNVVSVQLVNKILNL